MPWSTAAACADLCCACCAWLQGDEQAEEIVPALTGVFAEALKGGVSNLSFGDLSGQLGGCGPGCLAPICAALPGCSSSASALETHKASQLRQAGCCAGCGSDPAFVHVYIMYMPLPQGARCTSSSSRSRPTTPCSCAACRSWRWVGAHLTSRRQQQQQLVPQLTCVPAFPLIRRVATHLPATLPPPALSVSCLPACPSAGHRAGL